MNTRLSRVAVAAAAATALTSLMVGIVTAADHVDAPATTADAAADITDVYAWHTDQGTLVAVIDFAGLLEVGQPAVYDGKVVYGLHVDNDGDNVADQDVWVRFGENGAGEWGVQVSGLPGNATPVVGPVEQVIDAGLGQKVFAGLRDDPFFFDLQGYKETLMTGTLSFDSTRDSFAKLNVSAIVLEISLDGIAGGSQELQVWATTRR
ncbi:MAG TPA: DUF4331 family protein [Nannocystaceae bacterium]|nr:DUF4331 family protein [Nannocystaceae bacterium]